MDFILGGFVFFLMAAVIVLQMMAGTPQEFNQAELKVLDIIEESAMRYKKITESLLDFSHSDNGIGIPEDKIGKIFEPFFSNKQVGIETGLGLYVVSNIIRKHRGSIEVSSKPNEDAVFKISLPAVS